MITTSLWPWEWWLGFRKSSQKKNASFRWTTLNYVIIYPFINVISLQTGDLRSPVVYDHQKNHPLDDPASTRFGDLPGSFSSYIRKHDPTVNLIPIPTYRPYCLNHDLGFWSIIWGMIREFDVWFGGWLFDVGQHQDQNGSFHMGIFAPKKRRWNHRRWALWPHFTTCYPLVMTNIAIENDHRNSGFSH